MSNENRAAFVSVIDMRMLIRPIRIARNVISANNLDCYLA